MKHKCGVRWSKEILREIMHKLLGSLVYQEKISFYLITPNIIKV